MVKQGERPMPVEKVGDSGHFPTVLFPPRSVKLEVAQEISAKGRGETERFTSCAIYSFD